jgi:anti-sigma-K factor RskA
VLIRMRRHLKKNHRRRLFAWKAEGKKNNLQSLISSLGTWRSSVAAEQATEKVSLLKRPL